MQLNQRRPHSWYTLSGQFIFVPMINCSATLEQNTGKDI